VQWAQEWLRADGGSARARVGVLGEVKQLVRVLANSPASVEWQEGQLVVHFSALSSLAGLIICMRGVTAVQLMLPLFEHPPAPRVIDCLLEVLKCGKQRSASL
jgi:hypothetical protein